jgi:hypothetical protein
MIPVLLATLVVLCLPNLYFAFQFICFKLRLKKGSSQIVPDLLTITRKRRNLDICRCLATGPSFRYGQFSPALHKSKSSGLRSDCKQLRHDSRILVCHSVLMTLKTPDV